MTPLVRILGINLLIFIGYILLGAAVGSVEVDTASTYAGMFIAALVGVPIQCLVNLILMIVSFTRQQSERGKAFLLSLLLILLVGGGGGFFSCLVMLGGVSGH